MILEFVVIFKNAATTGLWFDQGMLVKMRDDSKLGQAVGEVFELLRDSVYRYSVGMLGNPAEAEDLVQEVFLRLYTCLQEGQQMGNIRAWVYRVAHNLAVDHQRKLSHLDSFDPDAWDRVCCKNKKGISNPEQALLEKERKELFQKALKD